MKKVRKILMLLMAAILLLAAVAHAEEGTDPLAVPVFTETECAWDEAGHLVSETAYDAEGNPARIGCFPMFPWSKVE